MNEARVAMGQYDGPKTTLPNGDVVNTTPFLNMWDEFGGFVQRLNAGESVDKWQTEGKAKFHRSHLLVQRDVISGREALVTTVGNITSDIIGAEFGAKSKGIFIFVDEAAFLTEPQIAVVVSTLTNRDRVKAIVLIGDHEQLAPFVQGDQGNEFANQLARPLFYRLVSTGFPASFLAVQHRMHEEIAKYPMAQVYDGRVTNGAEVNRPLDAKFDRYVTTTFGQNEEKRRHLVFLNVVDGAAEKQGQKKSRYNDNNMAAVRAFCLKVRAEVGVHISGKMVILTMYHAQKERYQSAFIRSAKDVHFPLDELPKVFIVDQVQGQDFAHVIVDLVVSDSTDYGFLGDERRVNVAITRAKDFLMIVGNTAMAKCGRFTTNWSDIKKSSSG